MFNFLLVIINTFFNLEFSKEKINIDKFYINKRKIDKILIKYDKINYII